MKKNITVQQTSAFAKYFSPAALFSYIQNVCLTAGAKLIYLVLLLYYTMVADSTPFWAKSIIAGGLGYFICPIDFIPDVTPFIGFTDDFTALTACALAVITCITPEIKQRAKKQLQLILGIVDETVYGDFA